jgi:DeoR family fructose operon transcriptional repressor
MLSVERHHAILRLLSEQGRVTVAEIAERFRVSSATARRDAVLLAEAGKAARSHGGLLPARFFREEPSFRSNSVRQLGLKARIARRAVELIPHEGNVFVDAGTTCLEVGRLLIDRPDLRVFTNSIPLLALASDARATLTGIGGEAQKGALALTGGLAQAWLSHLRFDAVVIGASGLDMASGAYANELGEAAIKTEALRRSAICVLVADAGKWGRPAAVRFAPMRAFTAFVTSQGLPRGVPLKLAADKVQLCLV